MSARHVPLVVVVALSGCQILGISAIPCDPEAEGQCPDGMVCRDFVCAKPTTPSEGEGEGESEVLGPVRDVDRTCDAPALGPQSFSFDLLLDAQDIGTAALSPALAGLDAQPALTFDVDACDQRGPACPSGTPSFGARQRAPVGTGTQIAFADPASLPLYSFEPDGAFAFEVIARVPAGAGTILRLTSGIDELLELTTAASEDGVELDLVLDGGYAVLAAGVGGTWVHVLCVIDPSEARRAAADGVLCAVDGGPPLYAPLGRADGLGADTLGIALPLSGESALAWLNVWSSVEGLPTAGLDRLDAVIAIASERLWAYAGMRVAPARPANAFSLASNKLFALPEGEISGEDFVLVGPRWPRTVLTQDGADAALLLEPSRIDLSALAFRSCVDDDDEVPFDGSATPDALHPACARVNAAGVDAEAFDTAPLVLSAWVQTGGGEGVLTFVAGDDIGESCTVTLAEGEDPVLGDCGAMTVRIEGPATAGVRRVVMVTSASAVEGSKTTVSMTFAGADGAAVWGAQLEQGLDATSVIDPDVIPGNGAREPDQFFFHGAHSELAQLRMRIYIDAPDVDGEFTPIALLRDQLFSDSLVFSGVNVSGGVVEASAVLLEPFEVNPSPQEITLTGTQGDLAPETTLIASTDASDACGSTSGCAFVELDPLPAAMTMSHLLLSGSGEALRLRGANALVTGSGSPPLSYGAMVEPRVNGCTFDAAVLAQFERCDEHTSTADCGDSDAFVDVDATEEAAALPGRIARVLSAPKAVALALDAPSGYLVEARFRVPADDVPILALTDDAGGPAVLALSSESGAVRIDVRSASAPVATETDEWVQLLCALYDDGTGQRVTCFRNLGGAPVFDTASAYAAAGATLTLGEGVAFDRVRVLELSGEFAPYAFGVALLRLPQSFGLHASLRREFTFVSAARGGLAHEQIGGALFVVGAGWPRISVADEKPAWLVEPALADALDDDFSQFDLASALSPSTEAGPGPRSSVFGAVDVTLTAGGLDQPGCVSVFVRRKSSEARVTLSAGGAEDGVDSGGGWRRLSACTDAASTLSEATIAVHGEALLAHPQLDGLAVTAPVVGASREREWIDVDTRDLTLGLFGFNLSFDADVRGAGLMFQLDAPGYDTAYAYRVLRTFNADGDEVLMLDLEEMAQDGQLIDSLLSLSFPLDPSGQIALAMRETSLWLSSSNGARLGGAFWFPSTPAVAFHIGARDPGPQGTAVLRVHEVRVRPVLR